MIAAASYGLSALQDAFGIVLGIVCVLSLPGSWFGNKNQRNRNENEGEKYCGGREDH